MNQVPLPKTASRSLDEPTRLLLDPNGLYWALFDAPPVVRGFRAGRRSDEALLYAFEPFIPAPIDEVEARFVRLEDRIARVLACGIERTSLAALLDNAESSGEHPVESATPAGAPECVLRRLGLEEGDLASLLARLELRSRQFESPTRSLRRGRGVSLLAVTAVVSSGLLCIGLLRAAQELHREAADARAAAAALSTNVLDVVASSEGGAPRAAGASASPEMRLAATLRGLERTRDRSAQGALAQDRAATFAQLLSVWPREIPVRIDQAHFEQDSITFRGEVRDAGDYERLALALGSSLDGWVEQSKSASKSRDAFGFTLVLRPAPTPASAPGTAPAQPAAPATGKGGRAQAAGIRDATAANPAQGVAP